MKKIKIFLLSAVTLFSIVGATAPLTTAFAANASTSEACKTLQDFNPDGKGCSQANSGVSGIIRLAIQMLSLVAGIIAVIMLIVAGLSYITSDGDASKISHAKSSLIYAIIGLVVVVFAQLIVRFVLSRAS